MNERIKELYTQVCQDQNLPFTIEHNSAYMLDAFANKFAELIVMECLTICEELGDKGMDGHYCADKIKQHFGVKE